MGEKSADEKRSGPTDVAAVRRVLARELETINEYEEMARTAQSEEIRAFFLHLAKEEKEHVAEATFLLRKLDPDQEADFQKGGYGTAHFQGAAAAAPQPAASLPAPPRQPYLPEGVRLPSEPSRILHALPAPVGPGATPFTVGALKRSR